MIVITVARKPLSREASSVASNVLKHVTGGLNIDGCRVQGTWKPEAPKQAGGRRGGIMGKVTGHPGGECHAQGRWPSNLILEHLPGCQCVGSKSVKGSHDTTGVWGKASSNVCYGHYTRESKERRYSYTQSGKEEILDWHCVSGCPVADLDGQSGERPGMSGGGAQTTEKNPNWVIQPFNRRLVRPEWLRCDTGGASRFFKQIQGEPCKVSK